MVLTFLQLKCCSLKLLQLIQILTYYTNYSLSCDLSHSHLEIWSSPLHPLHETNENCGLVEGEGWIYYIEHICCIATGHLLVWFQVSNNLNSSFSKVVNSCILKWHTFLKHHILHLECSTMINMLHRYLIQVQQTTFQKKKNSGLDNSAWMKYHFMQGLTTMYTAHWE